LVCGRIAEKQFAQFPHFGEVRIIICRITGFCTSREPRDELQMISVQTQGRPVLRILGTAATLIEPLRREAERDLGITLAFEVLDGVSAQRRAAIQPKTYDVYDQWFHNIDIVWSSAALQPIRTQRLKHWDRLIREDHAIGVRGRLGGADDMPLHSLYVQGDLRLGAERSERIGVLPTVYNVDSFGYLPDALPRDLASGEESWGWILDERVRGRVALVADPTVGSVDAALAANTLGLTHFANVGRLSISEIDELVRILMRRKRAGHFAGFWHSIKEARALIEGGEVAIESMWSPTVGDLRSSGFKIAYARPKEGYRAWHGCLGLSSQIGGRVLDVAYEFLNWWLAGPAGAIMARQGYYFSVRSMVQAHLTPAEWSYWYLGEPASCDMLGPDGKVAALAGAVREGGADWQRLSHIAVWTTTMPEHHYLVRRWGQLLAA